MYQQKENIFRITFCRDQHQKQVLVSNADYS